MNKRLQQRLLVLLLATLGVSVLVLLTAVQMYRYVAHANAPTELDALYIPSNTVHPGSTLFFVTKSKAGDKFTYGLSSMKDGVTNETKIQGLSSYDFDIAYDCGVVAAVRKNLLGANELVLMSVRTGNVIRAFAPDTVNFTFTQFSFSPDGSQLAVNYSFDAAKQKEYVRAILVFQANGQSIDMQAVAGVVTDDSTNNISDLRWSSDGLKLAWVETKGDQHMFSETVIGSDGIGQIKSSVFNSYWRTPYYEIPLVPIQGRYSQKSCISGKDGR